MMPRVLELKPLLVAAAIGALVLWAWGMAFERNEPKGSHWRDLAAGAGLGAVVQLGVRMAGVS